MPARVDVRHGSIFDEECDVLVIPCSAEGTVSLDVARELGKAGLPFPPVVPWGHLALEHSTNHRYEKLAYAAAIRDQRSAEGMVERIGFNLGLAAPWEGSAQICAPLLGAGSGGLSPMESAAAMERGFVRSAPENSVLTISVRRAEVMEILLRLLPPAFRINSQSAIVMHRAGEAPRPTRQVAVRNRPALTPSSPPFIPAHGPEPQEQSAYPTGRARRSRVFISYSHVDAKWLKRLRPHLRPLEREGALIWDDTRLRAGSKWREEIRQALDETKVAVLLISAAFIASDFINTNELPPLLKAAKEDGATILPVIISASRYDLTEGLRDFQAVNDPKQPLIKMRGGTLEEILDRIGREVERALKE
jgi:hypothetical protein